MFVFGAGKDGYARGFGSHVGLLSALFAIAVAVGGLGFRMREEFCLDCILVLYVGLEGGWVVPCMKESFLGEEQIWELFCSILLSFSFCFRILFTVRMLFCTLV